MVACCTPVHGSGVVIYHTPAHCSGLVTYYTPAYGNSVVTIINLHVAGLW